MGRLSGDPGVWGRLRYALGLRLPAENRDWVRHDLTDAGWRGRLLVRHLEIMLPICAALAMLPGEWWIRATVPLLAIVASTFTVIISSADIRDSRLRQHGFRTSDRRWKP